MQFSVGVEYALHCLLYMVDMTHGRAVRVKDLAEFQGVSETYLSKVYTKLRKSGLIKSIPGVNGGYELALPPEEITFWSVIEAIEGNSSMFQCAEIRRNIPLLDKNNLPDVYTKCPCTIKTVMIEAENQMRNYLDGKTLAWLHGQVKCKVTKEQEDATKEWFDRARL